MQWGAKLLVWPCHGEENQFFAFAGTGQIVIVEEYCVGINNDRDVIVVKCSSTDPTQLWTYNNEVRIGSTRLFTFVNNKFAKKA